MTQGRVETQEAQPLTDGQAITHRVGAVIISVQCVRPNAAYRCSVTYASSGFEVDALSQSFPTEAQARTAARGAYKLFNRGAPVQLVLDSIAYARQLVNSTAA